MLKFKNLKVKKANNFKERLFGLMFKKNIDYALFFPNCKSIHTFFMKDEIDVIITDKNNKIIKQYKKVKPWKIIISPKGGKNIYELPKNTLK